MIRLIMIIIIIISSSSIMHLGGSVCPPGIAACINLEMPFTRSKLPRSGPSSQDRIANY